MQLSPLNCIRNFLSDDTAYILVHALITSRLDNGNALLCGISNNLLDKLQRTQNAAAHIHSKTHKYDHITPTLIQLHWLPIRQRIQFKNLLLTWKSLNRLAPSYISQLLTPYVPTWTLRLSDKLLLKTPKDHFLPMATERFLHVHPNHEHLFPRIFVVVFLWMHLKIVLTGGNWQKWKRVFLTCPCHEIYGDEAVGLKGCKNTWKITIFVKMWNLGQYRENLIFCQ